jgi:thymidylate synthase
MIFPTTKVQDIRNLFIDEYLNKRFIKDKSGCNVIELIGAKFIADEPFIFGKPNDEYIKRELDWYVSQSLNVNDLEKTPKIWKQVADSSGFINSNYGFLIWSKENYSQYDHCLEELKKNPESRRASMIYNRPNIWEDYNKNGRSDFICTCYVQYFIRDNKLITSVVMRSNDCWAGYRNDKAFQDYVTNKLSKDLNIEVGLMIWSAESLHLYENNFSLIDDYIKTLSV